MGASKAAEFSMELNQIANLCKGLAHPARVAIINYLLKNQTCTSKEIVARLPLSQPTISQHFAMLVTVGLITGKTNHNTVCYRIEEESLKNLSKYCVLSLDIVSELNQFILKKV